jgi:hypothetical protein
MMKTGMKFLLMLVTEIELLHHVLHVFLPAAAESIGLPVKPSRIKKNQTILLDFCQIMYVFSLTANSHLSCVRLSVSPHPEIAAWLTFPKQPASAGCANSYPLPHPFTTAH